MATKRRRSSTAAKQRTSTARRRKTTTPRVYTSNPTRRRHRASASPRRAARRRSVLRRSNPSTGSLLTQGLELAGGITLVGLLQMFVPPIGGASPIASFGRKAGSGYLLGMAMEKFNVGRSYAKVVQLSGVALGLGDLINAYLMPAIGGFFRPAPQAQPANQAGMADLVTLPAGNYDPYYGSTPRIANEAPRQNKAAALRGLLTMPVMPGAQSQRFGR